MLNKNKIQKLLGDSMGNLIGLKNMLIFSAVLFTIGSVSAQEALAGGAFICISNQSGNWNNPAIWDSCNGVFPDSDKDARIASDHEIIITGDEQVVFLFVEDQGDLFIDCDASLLAIVGGSMFGTITNHGTFTASLFDFVLFNIFSNSGDHSGVVVGDGGSIVKITSICDRPIGGTVGSMDTATLLVAGAQANMGLWSLALVGIVGAGAAITYKLKSKKTEK